MLYAKWKCFTAFFPIWMPFISFSYLISLVRTSSKMLSQSGKNEHTCLIPNLRDRSVSSSLSIIFAVGFLTMLFSRLKLPPSLSVLITRDIGFVKCFPTWSCNLPFIDMVYYINCYFNVKLILHSWAKSHLVVMYNLLFLDLMM